MKKNIVLVLMLTSLLTACNKQEDKNLDADASQTVRQNMEERAKKTIADSLKDPGSAQFRNIRETSPGILCGEVNGKNAMGGYVGFQRFEWTLLAPDFANILSETSSTCR